MTAAKVNLALKVGTPRSDGFHPVETVYQSVDLYDRLVATRGTGISLVMHGEGAAGIACDESNLAWRAAAALAAHAGVVADVHMEIEKRIPIAGGMAGGSADAAAALVACDALWELETPREQLLALAAELGSDVPFSLIGGTQLGTGRGETLAPLIARGRLHWVFALDDGGLSTPEVYREFDRLSPDPLAPHAPEALLHALAAGDAVAVGKALVNDLQVAALSLKPALQRVLNAGKEAGAIAGIVSGSGPTCAFLARDGHHAIRIATELQGSGFVSRTVIASGPARGAFIESVS